MKTKFSIFSLFIISVCYCQVSYMPYKIGNIFGVSDLNKNIIIEPQFTRVSINHFFNNEMSIIGYKEKNGENVSSLIVGEKLIIKNEPNIFYRTFVVLIEGISSDKNAIDNRAFKLYGVSGKRINDFEYEYVKVLSHSKHFALILLKNVQHKNKLALYDIDKEVFTKVYADNISNIGTLLDLDNTNKSTARFVNNHQPFEVEVTQENGKIIVNMNALSSNTKIRIFNEKNLREILVMPAKQGNWNSRKIDNLDSLGVEYKFLELKQCSKIWKAPYELNFNCSENFRGRESNEKFSLVQVKNKLSLYFNQEEILPSDYDEIFMTEFSNYVIYKKNNKWATISLETLMNDGITNEVQFENLPFPTYNKTIDGRKIYEMYNAETNDFLYYALEDGTLYFEPN